MAKEIFSGCAKGGLDVQGEGAQTPSAGVLKHRQLQDVFVQVHSDVGSQFIREVVQQLKKEIVHSDSGLFHSASSSPTV